MYEIVAHVVRLLLDIDPRHVEPRALESARDAPGAAEEV
jgi:hypothetical protein